eukprot:TRINITY_DN7087_c0_g1_i2.p1 TRINITY_DN7087_c0_g1~~TRINITY_DN7087_c0_g1_i2.p1  ORF type:complete len:390 (-),score=111.26 TRINITY_DN7087_c0_g1_i2:36-1205(-)
MTVSFHQFGDFFPGTGDVRDVGAGKGKNYSVNFPLKEGIDDETYHSVFKPIIKEVMTIYRPGAVVLQCGADSLTGDRLGCFNLSIKGHAECITFLKSFNLPLLILGGGGYTIKNVARCWAYETSVLLGVDIEDDLPFNEYLEYYGPDYRLHIPPTNMENKNAREYLEKCKNKILENLRHLQQAPSAAQHEVPPDMIDYGDVMDDDEDLHSDRRSTNALRGGRRGGYDGELSDSDDEDGRRDNRFFDEDGYENGRNKVTRMHAMPPIPTGISSSSSILPHETITNTSSFPPPSTISPVIPPPIINTNLTLSKNIPSFTPHFNNNVLSRPDEEMRDFNSTNSFHNNNNHYSSHLPPSSSEVTAPPPMLRSADAFTHHHHHPTSYYEATARM